MTHRYTFITTCIMACLSSLSLVAATTYPQTTLPSTDTATLWNDDDLLSDNPEGISGDSTLIGGLDTSPEALQQEKTEEDLSPPFEEGNSNIEEQNRSAVHPSDMNPDLQKVLYDAKLNYGTGAPVPKPAPFNTTKRNLIVLGTSAVLATVAMLVVSSNKGMDAPNR